MITKNKVISSEGAGQGKCNEEIEKKLITITISFLLIRIFLVIIFSRMFCQQNIKVSGCFRCFDSPFPCSGFDQYISFLTVLSLNMRERFSCTMTGFNKHMESVKNLS